MPEQHYLKDELYALIKNDDTIFEFLQSASLDGMWYWDLENLEHEWMNAKFWTTLGYDPATMPHRADAWQDIINQDDLQVALDNFQKHLADPNHPYDQVVRYRHKDGSTVWIRCRGLAIRNDDGTPVRMLGAHTDLTALKKAERRAAEDVELYKTIHENQSAYFIKISPAGNYTYVNDFYCEDFGWSRADLLGQSSLIDIVKADHQRTHEVGLACYAEPGKRFKARLRKILKDGTIKVTDWEFTALTDAQGEPGELVCIGVDVTKQVEADAALKASEAQFRFIAENTSDGILMFSHDKIVYASPAYTRILGYSLEEEKKRTYEDIFALIHPEDHERIVTLVGNAMAEQQRYVSYEYRALHKDGHYVWREDRATILYGEDGLPVQTILMARDITEQKQAEIALRHSEHRYRLLADNSQDLISLHDPDQRTVYVSPSYEWILGYSPEEMLEKSPAETWELIHPDDITPLQSTYQAVVNTHSTESNNYRLKKKDGTYIWLETKVSMVTDTDDGRSQLLVNSRDITDRKRAEDALRDSERRYRFLTENNKDLISLRKRDYTLLYTNPAYEKLLGYSQDELSALSSEKLLHPDDVSKFQAAYHTVIEGRSVQDLQYRLRKKDGAYVWMEVSVGLITDDVSGEQRILASSRDISQRKHAEDALRESKAQLDLFFSQSMTGFFFMMLDEPIDWHDGADKDALLDYVFNHQRVTKANQAFFDQYGDTDRTMLGFTPADFFAHDLEGGKQVWREFFDRGYWYVETEERRADGAQVFIEGDYICLYDDQGRITGHFGVQQNVTSRKQSEQALAESEAKFRSFVENANDLIVTINLQGEFLYISPMWEAVKGFGAEGLIGTPFVPLIHPEDAPLALDAINTVITNQETYNGLIYRFKHGDGTWHWFSANGAPICDDAGNVTSILVTVRDITSDKHAAQTMQATLKRLEQALANNTLLMKELHHRVKNNLAIVASLLALQSYGLKDATAKEALRESRARIVTMSEIHELMYRHDNTKTIVFDEYLNALVSRMERSFGRSQAITFALETPSLELPFNQAIPLGLIVNELLTNATKYAFPKGHTDPQVNITITADDGLTLVVADNGVGLVDAEALETSDSLGMTVIHSLTGQLGGNINFDNRPDAHIVLQATLTLPRHMTTSETTLATSPTLSTSA